MTPDELEIKEHIKSHVDSGISSELDIDLLVEELELKFSAEMIEAVVDKVATELNIEKTTVAVCPEQDCHHILDAAAIDNNRCDYCETDYYETGNEPILKTVYSVIGEPSRDIRWMIVVHGMNTRGAWQEDFSWLIANRLKYSAPVLVYKYGWATVDVLSRSLQRLQVKSLGRRIQRAVEYAGERGLPKEPDIVAHSFGTHLITLVLNDPEFSDLNVGRVITVGSIVRPDFDWTSLIKGERVDAVLNHMGGKDKPVLIAQYLIPGTGPGGRVGYLDNSVENELSAAFGHSDALQSQNLKSQLQDGGLWDRFLTQPEGKFVPDKPYRPDGWDEAWFPLRAISRLIGWVIIVLIGPFSWLRRKIDA